MSHKKPNIGDVIAHTEPQFNRTTIGTVTLLLSAQFVYVTDDEQTRFCLYKEQWKLV